MRTIIASAILFSSLILSHAEVQAPIPLWPDGAPGALGTNPKDIPTLTPYLPDPTNATGAAMVICPGGGYVQLAPHEGNDYALWLNQHGVTCFVLKYRLGSHGYHYPAEFQDVTRAVRWVRANAADWKIDPHRVGIMGSSAGGHLASTLLTHFDSGDANSADPIERQSSRPDIGILCYAVITMGEYTHRGFKGKFAGQTSVAGAGEIAFQRIAGQNEHAAVFPLDHVRGQDCADGEHADVCRGAAEKSCAVRFAHLSEGRTRHGVEGQTALRASASVGRRLCVLAETAGLGEGIKFATNA